MAYKLATLGLVSLIAPTVLAVPHGGQHMHLHEGRAEVTVTVTAGAPAAATPAAAAPAAHKAAAPAAAKVAAKPKGSSSKSSGSIGGTKAGLAYNDPSLLSSYGSKYSWCWNWGASSGGDTGSAKYVPMLKDQASEGAWSGMVGSIKGSAPAVLGYNEPDVNGISASYAASRYPDLMTTPLGGSDVLIGSPGPTSSAGSGSQWLDEFLGSCTSCGVDFAQVHWYANKDQSAEANADAFKSYISDTITPIVNKYKDSKGAPMKIWVTEFGYVPPANDGGRATSPADQATFIEQTLPFLNGAESVAQYAFFMVGNDAGDMTGSVKSAYMAASG
ncbi:MAG: hypothetical protein M1828_003488 [Chrysothrix sp. TS-e1954]|nr:MAG: hypothetical protein M1828_003488 [Chrysothrix sp. TS-e1954]